MFQLFYIHNLILFYSGKNIIFILILNTYRSELFVYCKQYKVQYNYSFALYDKVNEISLSEKLGVKQAIKETTCPFPVRSDHHVCSLLF